MKEIRSSNERENTVAAPALKAILICLDKRHNFIFLGCGNKSTFFQNSYSGTDTINKLGHWAIDSNEDSGYIKSILLNV